MKENIQDVREGCKHISRILEFLFYLVLIVLIGRILYTTYTLFIPSSLYQAIRLTDDSWRVAPNLNGFAFSTTINEVYIYIPSDDTLKNPKLWHQVNLGVDLFIHSVFLWTLWLLKSIYISIEKEYSPFMKKNCKRLQTIGKIVITMAFIPEIIKVTLFYVLCEGGRGYFFGRMSPLPMALLGGIILSIAYIFSYGCMLQNEYDETL